MTGENPFIVHAFTGRAATMDAAQDAARTQARAWYETQTVLYFMEGVSVFQFSTAAYYDPSGYFVFIITAFDVRFRSEFMEGKRSPAS